MSELKPCPFCGGKAVIESHFGRYFFVMCEKGACEGNKLNYKNEHDAITAWNTRTAPQPSSDSNCPVCGRAMP